MEELTNNKLDCSNKTSGSKQHLGIQSKTWDLNQHKIHVSKTVNEDIVCDQTRRV